MSINIVDYKPQALALNDVGRQLSNDQSVSRLAKLYLGFSYLDNGQLGKKVIVEDLSNNNFGINNLGIFHHAVIGRNIKKCEIELENSLNLHFTIPLNNHENLRAAHENLRYDKNYFILSITCLKLNKIFINKFSELKLEKNDYKLDNIIVSGTCCIGYKILFEFIVQDENEENFRISDSKANDNDLLFSLCDYLSINQKEIKKKLKNKIVSQITLKKSEGIGGYTIPSVKSPFPNAFQEILMKINDDFHQKYPSICSREFRIDLLKDLKPSIDFISFSPLTDPENQFLFFKDLEEEIKSNLSESYFGYVINQLGLNQKNGQPVSLQGMFIQIEEIFLNQFRNLPEKNNEPYTVVIGKTGGGKSLLIGYLLGFQIQKKKISVKISDDRVGTKNVYDYQDEVKYDFERPKIGHESSETKGALVYKNYIDASGFSDLSGFEADVCNAVAMQITVERYRPQKVIIVLDSSSILSNRASGFLDLIGMINRIIDNAYGEKVLSNILFVINDKNARLEVDEIMTGIYDAIHSIKQERDKYLPMDAEYSFLRKEYSWAKFKGMFKEPRQLMDLIKKKSDDRSDDVIQFVQEFQSKIEILSRIKEENIIIADFSDTKMRDSILEWIGKKKKGISHKYFNMQNLAPSSKTRVIAAVNAARFYFDFLKKECERYQNALNIGKTIDSVIPGSNQLEDINSELVKKINTLKLEKESLSEVISTLEKNTAPTEWPSNLDPETPIAPRNFLSFFNWVTKGYSFKCDSNIPELVKCQYVMHGDNGKGDFSIKESDFVNEREVMYTPSWWGFESNCRTKIRLWVKKKDHPSTQAEIADKYGRIKQINEELQNLQDNIESLVKNRREEFHKRNALLQEKYKKTIEKLNKYGNFMFLINQISLIFSITTSGV